MRMNPNWTVSQIAIELNTRNRPVTCGRRIISAKGSGMLRYFVVLVEMRLGVGHHCPPGTLPSKMYKVFLVKGRD